MRPRCGGSSNVYHDFASGVRDDARVGALSECEAAGGPACELLNVYCIRIEHLRLQGIRRVPHAIRAQGVASDPVTILVVGSAPYR